MPVARGFVACGALMLLLAIVAGAFGAHALEARLAPRAFAAWQTAVLYQFVHGLGLLLVGALLLVWRQPALVAAGVALLGGLLFFCGGLYAWALTGQRVFAALAPVGGVAWLVAWGLVAWAAWRAAA